jgi:hypothetical protein
MPHTFMDDFGNLVAVADHDALWSQNMFSWVAEAAIRFAETFPN